MAASPIHPDVVAEAQDVIDALSRDLVAAQGESQAGSVTPQRINALFRSGHTLKGLVGLFGLKEPLRLAHAMEDVLEAARMGRLTLTAAALHLLFACVEEFLRHIAQAAAGAPAPPNDDLVRLLGSLDALLRGPKPQAAPSAPLPPRPVASPEPSTAAGHPGDAVRPDPPDAPDPADASDPPEAGRDLPLSDDLHRMLTEYEAYRLAENLRLGTGVVCVRAQFSLLTCDVELAALEATLAAHGEIIARLPSAAPGPEAALVFELLLATGLEVDALAQILNRADIALRRIGAAAPPAPPADSPQATGSAAAKRTEASVVAPASGVAGSSAGVPQAKPADGVVAGPQEGGIALQAQTVRVDIRRLDTLMHMVGELNLTRVALDGIGRVLRQKEGMHGLAQDLERELLRLERRVTSLQSSVLKARMVPLTTLFDRLVRMGMKVAGDVGVEVQFALSGAHTELDKRIVEELADPLAHLVRNAVDHGIEAPAARLERGKARFGVVTLHAVAQGNQVQVHVGDDGHGMDAQNIRAVALRKKLVTQARLAEMSKTNIFRLVLLPGFSTRTEVSEISGRGVGLDVVKTHIERLGGSVDIDTQPGAGTTFVLTAPVTLAILPALIVAAGGASYAIALAHVVETVEIEPEMRRRVQGQPVLQVRDATLSLRHLAQMLDTTLGERATAAGEAIHAAPLAVVVGVAGRQVALAVDDVIGQQDIVIKPLGPRLAHLRGISGAAELDDRRLILALDVLALTQEGEMAGAESGQGITPGAEAPYKAQEVRHG